MTTRNDWWRFQAAPNPTLDRFKAQVSLKEQADAILARPGARTSTGAWNPRVVSIEDVKLVRQVYPQEAQPQQGRPGKALTGPEAIRNVLGRTALTEAEIRRGPGWVQPVARAVNEMTSIGMLGATALTAGVGPAAARGLTALAAKPAVQAIRGVPTALRLAAGAVAPVVGGGLGARMAGELGLGTAATLGGQEVSKRIPETAPTVVKIGAPLVGGLVAGGGAIAGARAAGRAIPEALVRVPQRQVQEAGLRLAGARATAGGAAESYASLAGFDKGIKRMENVYRNAEEVGATKSTLASLDEELTSLRDLRQNYIHDALGDEAFAEYEQLQRRLGEAQFELSTPTGGVKAPNFGTAARAEYDSLRRQASAEGRRFENAVQRNKRLRATINSLQGQMRRFEEQVDAPVAKATERIGGERQANLGEGFETNRTLEMPMGAGAGTRTPLASPESLKAAQLRRETIARGQQPLPATEAAKEPWQMTKAEIGTEFPVVNAPTGAQFQSIRKSATGLEDFQAEISRVGAKTKATGSHGRGKLKVTGEYTKGEIESIRDIAHRRVVEKALSEGKPVPPEVLADYPDLVKAVPTQPVAGEANAPGQVRMRASLEELLTSEKALLARGGVDPSRVPQVERNIVDLERRIAAQTQPVAPVTESVTPPRRLRVSSRKLVTQVAQEAPTVPGEGRAGVVPPAPAATPLAETAGGVGRVEPTAPGFAAETVPTAPPVARVARLRLSIRATEREGGGFLISGRDTTGRQVRVFAQTLDEAKQARENIRAGKEAFVGTEAEAAARATTKAERKYRAALKRGELGATERARLDLEQAQATSAKAGGVQPPTEPPKLPPTVGPGGGMTPPPDWNTARNKLVSMVRGAVRMNRQEMEQLRSRAMRQKAGQALGATERALARGESPLPGIRAAQRGALPELRLPTEQLTADEFRVLRDSIYKKLGPELNFTAADIEESLARLAVEGKLPTEAEALWMEEIFGPELVEALGAFRTRGQRIGNELLELWNLPRALMASFDDSAVLRQGAMLLPEGSPALRAYIAHWKVIKKVGYDGLTEEIRANAWFNHGRAHGLDLTLPSTARTFRGREEAFFGAGMAGRIPIIKQTIGKGIEISERLYSGYLNKLRMDVYASHAEELQRMGAGFDAFKELAENINILSGRATLGRAQALAPYLNGIFFSARLNWARAQAPFRILRQAPNLGTEEGRLLAKMLARDVYGFYAGVGGMLGLAAAAGVIAVELDPRSSDFGKAQVGTVRLDPWSGQQQMAVLIARLATGETKKTTTGQIQPQDWWRDTLTRFIESKFHPALGKLSEIRRGKTYIGEELTAEKFAEGWLPLFVQDIREIAEGTTPGVAGLLGLAAFQGVSVYNIPGVPRTVLNQLQGALDAYNAIPTDTLELGRGQLSRTQYRQRNPDADAALFLAGQVSSLETQGAVQAVVALVRQHKLNPDSIRGVAERKERQQKASEAGQRLERNKVDNLIRLLEAPGQSQATPAPSGASTFQQLLERSRGTARPQQSSTFQQLLERSRQPVGAGR